MSEYMKKAIEEMERKLQDQMNEVAETKKAINVLCRQIGQPPRFEDVASESVKAVGGVKRDQFFQKPLSTAVREYLQMRGSAATLDEIYEALKQGGFEFVGKDEMIRKRGLQISLRKNRQLFAYLKATNTFGLWDFYGGRPKKDEEEESEAQVEEPELEEKILNLGKKQTA